MSALTKSRTKASSRQQIALKGVSDDVLLLPGNEYRAVMRVSAINFELKSEAEQDALIDTYQSFLNSLSTDLQILVRIRELDMDKYLADFARRSRSEVETVYQEQNANYIQFVSKLVTTNKILTRYFYVVVPLSGETDFAIVKEQLALTVEIVSKGLARMGMHASRLTSLALLELFYSFYNPVDSKRQPLTDQTLQLLTEAYL
jgi:hypothetical protein